MNLVEKLLAHGAGLPAVHAGELVWSDVHLGCIDDIQFAIFHKALAELGGQVGDPTRVAVVGDHYLPPATIEQAEIIRSLRAFADAHHLPHCFLTEGIKHQILPEAGLVRPGMVVAATDSHTPTMGAFGAFATAVGPTEMAAIFARGRMWFKVPETVRIVLSGALPDGVYAKDIALRLLGDHGTAFARYRALEFTGDLIGRLPAGQRVTLCNMSAEMGAKAAVIAPDAVTAEYYGRSGLAVDCAAWQPDPDARYVETIHLDVSTLEPQVAMPSSPSNVVPVRTVAGQPFHQAFIGSCAGANAEDLEEAARVLVGQKVDPQIRCLVTPASVQIYRSCLRSGAIEKLMAAGFTVTNPGCGACAGIHMGVLGEGEVRIASQNRNFVGRGGHAGSQIILASAATVAASAITGRLTDPREFLTGRG